MSEELTYFKGTHRVIAPKKTIEGAVGGVIVCIITTFGMTFLAVSGAYGNIIVAAVILCRLGRALRLRKAGKAECLKRAARVPQLNELCFLAQLDIVDHRCELIKDNDLTCRAALGKVEDLTKRHKRDRVLV